MRIAAIIVTYNRLALLKQSVEAVLSQSISLDNLIIINNNSQDGTKDYLDNLNDNRVIVFHLPENIGGAGGFSYGLRKAAEGDFDWAWIMDDDTIPTNTALQELCKAMKAKPEAGYFSSRALWTDNTLHVMNCQWMPNKQVVNKHTPTNIPVSIRSASFVSLMINVKAIKKVGLPYKEFFIWCDDSEYTSRIFDAGYECYYVGQSVVLHKTATNYMPSLSDAPAETAWKFYYNMRNNIFIRRKKYKNPLVAMIKVLNYYRLELRRLNKRQTADKDVFKQQLRRGFKDGLTFNATIEMV